MEAEKALIDLLLATSAVTDLIGQQIYFAEAPQTTPPPFVAMHRVSGPRVQSLTGPSGLAGVRVQLDVYAKSGNAARAIAKVIRETLDGYRGTQSGVNLQAVLLLDEMDRYDADPELRSVSQDYRVWFNE